VDSERTVILGCVGLLLIRQIIFGHLKNLFVYSISEIRGRIGWPSK
jgi:hypothetical protein